VKLQRHFIAAQISVLLGLMAELFDAVPVEGMRGAEQAVREAAAAPPENLGAED
jgi:hypothetical protein